MTSHIGYGSQISAPITSNTDTLLVASGKCVVDKIFVNGAGHGSLSIAIQGADGVDVQKWTTILISSADAYLYGISCGPLGIAVADGLNIETSSISGTASISIAYRSGLN